MTRHRQSVTEEMTAGRALVSAVWDLLLALVVVIPLALPPVVVGLIYWFLFRNSWGGSRPEPR